MILFSPHVQLITSSQQQADQILPRLNQALLTLRELAEQAYARLCIFTQYLTPLQEKGTVSYSSESLPGYSVINFSERDDIDLLDDLIHENGHHQLNYYLYCHELINERDPSLYFSPWRECLRPLRGIYHGFCTFFWACDLFYTFINNHRLNDCLTSAQIDKIYRRYIEEKVSLEFCYRELEQAFQRGFITAEGKQLIKILYEKVEQYQLDSFDPTRKELVRSHQKKIRKYLKDLREESYNQFHDY